MEEQIHHIEDAEFEMTISDTAPSAIPESGSTNTENANVTSFENIFQFLASHKYPNGLNLNQKRTLRKAAANFSLIGTSSYIYPFFTSRTNNKHLFRRKIILHFQKQERKKASHFE